MKLYIKYMIIMCSIVYSSHVISNDGNYVEFKDWSVVNTEKVVLAFTYSKNGKFGKICDKPTKECNFVLIVEHTCKNDDIVPILVSTDSKFSATNTVCKVYEGNQKLLIIPSEILSHALDRGQIGFAIPELGSVFFSSRFSLSGSNAAILNAVDKAGLIKAKPKEKLPLGTHKL